MLIKVKVQSIYYETPDTQLGIFYYNSGRLTQKQAHDILLENDIEFEAVLKVQADEITLEMTPDELNEFKI